MQNDILEYVLYAAHVVKGDPVLQETENWLGHVPEFRQLEKTNWTLQWKFYWIEHLLDSINHGFDSYDGVPMNLAVRLLPINCMQLMVTGGYTCEQALLMLPELRVSQSHDAFPVVIDVRPYVLSQAARLKGVPQEVEANSHLGGAESFKELAKLNKALLDSFGWLEGFTACLERKETEYLGSTITEAKELFPLKCLEMLVASGVPFDDAMAMIPELRLSNES